MNNKDDRIINEHDLNAIFSAYQLGTTDVHLLKEYIEYLREINKAQEIELFKLRNRVKDQELDNLT